MIENLEGEDWKDIAGYEDLYQVSNKGRVKSLNYNHTGKERLLRPGTSNSYGHQKVQLCKNGITTDKLLHRLVGETFLSNPENKPCIDHLDTDPTNNSVDNLRWVSQKENSQNPLTIEHNNQKSVYCYETDTIYVSANEASRQLNVHHGNISSCCRGLRNHTGKYHFCYADDIKKERLL